MLEETGPRRLSHERDDSLVGVSPTDNYDEAYDQGNDHALILGGEQSGSAQERLISPASGGSNRNPKNAVSLTLNNLNQLD